MAAYAALVSLRFIIDQIQNHPRPPIPLDGKQVQSLTETAAFLQQFLEGYSLHVCYTKQADALECRIRDAAYAAENVIESHIVDRIRTSCPEKMTSIEFHETLQKVINSMDLIKKEAMEITLTQEKMGLQDQLRRLTNSADFRRSPSTTRPMVGVGDDALNEIMDKLIAHQSTLQIIPIVGMGGIGKTTLARNIYSDQLVKEHFHVCAWATISQEYDTLEILRVVLSQGSKADLSHLTENELGERLYKHLWGRMYLVVMDDMWSIDAWDRIKFFFPDNHNGSRIMITTRLSNLCFQVTGSDGFRMKFLDEETSWNLFRDIVFGQENCPAELEETGRKIVKNCNGLPLSIVVIGGLLTKYAGIREYWEYTLENTSSSVNLEDGEHCLQMLYTSYKELPVHLKPCFLYMGIFPEDSEIRALQFIIEWVAEGFLRPIDGKTLEEAAEEYLIQLINRNLILVDKLDGKTKTVKVDDLLRDLCLREAEKQRFMSATRLLKASTSGHPIITARHIGIHQSISYDPPQLPDAHHLSVPW